MKKILCAFLSVMLVLSMCLALVGCASEDVRGDITDNKTTESKVDSENKKPSQEETEAPTQDATGPEFSMGKSVGGTYTNDFLGISCTLPEEWTFYTDEQIKELNNVVGDYMDEEVQELLKNATIIYDMYAINGSAGASININMEKLTLAQLATLDIKQVLESQISTIETSYQNMGYSEVKAAYQKIEVDGKKFDGLKVTAKIQGYDFELVTFTFQKGSYLANVSVGTLLTDKLDTLLGYFTVK